MELHEFVKQTLVEIGRAMQEAHQELVKNEGKGIDDYNYTSVKFDIAVSEDQQSSKTGGGKLNVVSVFNLGGEVADSVKNSVVNRIQFEVKLHAKTAGRKFTPVVV